MWTGVAVLSSLFVYVSLRGPKISVDPDHATAGGDTGSR